MVLLKGWRYAAFIGTIVGSIGLTLYPIIIEPMMNEEKYSEKYFFILFLFKNI